MFESIKKLPYNDAAQVVYYTISEIRNPHTNSLGITERISVENRKVAQSIIRKIKDSSKRDNNIDNYINELYCNLMENASNNKMYSNIDSKELISNLYSDKLTNNIKKQKRVRVGAKTYRGGPIVRHRTRKKFIGTSQKYGKKLGTNKAILKNA